MINLFEKFINANRNIKDSQYPINYNGVIKAYYGINKEGFYRLSFLSTKSPEIKGITKNINIVQGFSSETNYWTCFDLKNDSLLSVFCTFGEDLISCVDNELDETRAISKLRARFNTWLALFKKTRTPLSQESAKGLFGELYFLNDFMLDKYGEQKSIKGWGGPEKYSKDFSVDETWYEIKTINTLSAVAKISSIQQLSSEHSGHLILIRVEEMADSFNGENCTINKLCQSIISKIADNELKDEFLEKLSEIGYDFCDDLGNKNFSVKKIESYKVSENFPVLRETDIKSNAINNVSYELIIKMIDDYKEDYKK